MWTEQGLVQSDKLRNIEITHTAAACVLLFLTQGVQTLEILIALVRPWSDQKEKSIGVLLCVHWGPEWKEMNNDMHLSSAL